MVSHFPFRLYRSVCLLILFAIGGRYGQSPKNPSTPAPQNSTRHHLPESGWLLANLDGDHEPDVVGTLHLGRTKDGYLYKVQLQLTGETATSSFAVLHKDSLGLKIVSLDIDGDDDLDLSVSDQLAQYIGIWINDGKGRFVESLPDLFSPTSKADLVFTVLDQHFVEQRSGVRERRRLPDYLAAARYVQPLASKSFNLSRLAAEQTVHFAVDPLDQRPPPPAVAV